MQPHLLRVLRHKLILALPLLAGCGEEVAVQAWQPGRGVRPPDILLISIDSLRPDHLGCYGYSRPTSPVIDRLAAEGVRFETAVSTTSWTLPAHAALFTGLFDSTHGVTNNNTALAPTHETLAERLRLRGYETIGFFGGPYLDPVFGFGQGFDHYESCMSPLGEHSHADVTGPRTLAAVERRLATRTDRPLFCFVHLWDVHYDYRPPAELLELFSPSYEGNVDFSNFDTNPAIHEHMSPRDRERLIALYDAEIRSVDAQVARLWELFGGGVPGRETLLLITADHGEEFFEHGKKGHQSSLFEEQVRIPLILVWPGKLPGGFVAKLPASIVDIAPTLAHAAGAESGWRTQGRDLSAVWNGGILPPAAHLLELLVDRNDWRALRTAEDKVMRARLEHGTWEAGYQLVRDARERRPAGREEAWLGERLHRMDELLEDGAILREKLGIAPQPHRYSAEMQQRLGFLGYTEAEPAPSGNEKK